MSCACWPSFSRLRPRSKPGVPPSTTMQADAAVLERRVGLHRGDHELGVDPVGDERLRTVDDVDVALAQRAGAHARKVGADAGLGHRDGREQLARDDARKPAAALLVGAVLQEVRHADVVVQRDPEAEPAHARALDLLADHDVEAEVVHAGAPELLRHGHPQEAVVARGAEGLERHDAIGIPLLVMGDDLALQEPPEALPEVVVLGLEEGSAHGRQNGTAPRRPARRRSTDQVSSLHVAPSCYRPPGHVAHEAR